MIHLVLRRKRYRFTFSSSCLLYLLELSYCKSISSINSTVILSITTRYTLLAFKFKGYTLTLFGFGCTLVSQAVMTDWQAISGDPCNDYSLFHNPELVYQYRQELADYNVSENGLVSIQSLEVVEEEVYQMAVNRCQSADRHCHWIPNSIMTDKHCSDCQPICHSLSHSINFIQFTAGVVIFLITAPLLYMGTFLVLSESVPRNCQVGFTPC